MISLDGLPKVEEEAVLLVGAGSVDGAWEPVLDALSARIPERSPAVANVYFATLVHRLRWLHDKSVRPVPSPVAQQGYLNELKAALEEYRSVTSKIAQALSASHFRTRPEGQLIREKFLRSSSPYRSFRVVTTNWDFANSDLIEEDGAGRQPGIDFLHGTFDIGLYLPGEVVDEPYRGTDNRSEFFTSFLGTVTALRDVPRLVVYGLSVSPLDAALGFLLQWAAKLRKRPFAEVIVVDPSFKPVIANLRVHLGNQRFIGLVPEELANFRLPEDDC